MENKNKIKYKIQIKKTTIKKTTIKQKIMQTLQLLNYKNVLAI